ncbi:MAG: hypothetical protein EPN62_00880 [Candidimonas sp.]|nr:MAG: hypothetical protein EPN77_01880 [Candidimonas sp.]TAM26883.1 MAG: hypothetical protein EPN62_00880 [Candidimonas sp.]
MKKYAREIMGLMAAYPGRDFKMVELVREATKAQNLSAREKDSARKAVRRILKTLCESKLVLKRPTRPGVRNYICYRWK